MNVMQHAAQLSRLDPKAALAIHRLGNRRASDNPRKAAVYVEARRHKERGMLTMLFCEALAAVALGFLIFVLHEGNPVLLAGFAGFTVAAIKDELRLRELGRGKQRSR